MKIYSFPTFNLLKVLITAEELNLDYEFHLLDATKGEHKSPEHMARHPLGKVPVLEYQGEHYIESNSICRLLAEENNNLLYANTPSQKAVINQWVDLMAFHPGRWMAVFFFEEAIKPNIPDSTPNQEQINDATEFLQQQLPVLEERLRKNTFLAGEAISIADTVAYAYCHTHEHTSVSFDDYPNIKKWYQAMKSRPAVERAMARLPNGSIVPF